MGMPWCGGHSEALEFLRSKQRETGDPNEIMRIQKLIEAEVDSHTIEGFVESLRSETAQRVLGRACLSYMLKHAEDLSTEFKRNATTSPTQNSDTMPSASA